MDQGNRKKRAVRWYLDDDDGGRELAEAEALPTRFRRLVRRTIRVYWLTLFNACGLILVGASGTILDRRDSEFVAIIAMGILFLSSVSVLVVGYAFNSKKIVYPLWEQVGMFLAHLTGFGLGAILGISLFA